MNKILTVKELIKLLELVENKELKVILEGCDCYGDSKGLEVNEDEGGGYILLTRY